LEIDLTSSNKSAVGTIAALWRFPVKSMTGERLPELELTQAGVLGDRAYALIDADTGKVVSAKSIKLFPDVLRCKAEFVEAPKRGGDMPPVRITLSTGLSVRSDAGDVDKVLSEHFHRRVRLACVAPDDFTIDQYHPDIEGADPGGNRDTVVNQKLGAALFATIGAPSPVPPGSFLDMFPVSVMTTSTLARFSELAPKSRFDERRFRMNVIIKTHQPGFVENEWVGLELAIGGSVRLNVAQLDARCVMTTLAQEELPQDTEVLRTLVRHNRVQRPGVGRYPCAGAYALVANQGSVRVEDSVLT
jgi:uncharacterized protein YcbX